MKKALLTTLIISAVLISLVAGTLIIYLAQANPVVVSIDDLWLESPQNKTYVQNFIQVSFNYSIWDEPVNNHESMQTSISCILDGLGVLVSNYEIISNKLPNSISYLVHFNITDLPNGSHTLSVHISATADEGFTTFAASSEVVTFAVSNFPSSINATPSPSTSPAPISTPSPSVPEFPSFIVLPLLMATILAGAIIYKRKLKQSQTTSMES